MEQSQKMKFHGEVVEIFESQGLRLAKISVRPCNILAIAAPKIKEAHLGDQVVIDATIVIDQVQDEIGAEPEGNSPVPPLILNFEDFFKNERR